MNSSKALRHCVRLTTRRREINGVPVGRKLSTDPPRPSRRYSNVAGVATAAGVFGLIAYGFTSDLRAYAYTKKKVSHRWKINKVRRVSDTVNTTASISYIYSRFHLSWRKTSVVYVYLYRPVVCIAVINTKRLPINSVEIKPIKQLKIFPDNGIGHLQRLKIS